MDYQNYDTILSLTLAGMVKCLYKKQQNFPISTFYSCISDSVQPLAVHSHWLLHVQPDYSGKRNTAKSCTEYSQYICSVQWILDLVTNLVSVKSVTKSRNVTKFIPTFTTKSKNGQRQNCHYIKDCH